MMRRLLATIVVMGTLGFALADATCEQAPSPENSGPYRIAGVLLNAVTGEPIRRGSIVVLRDEDGQEVATCITDNDGRFAIDRLAATKYELSATKRGFRPAFYDQHDEFSSAIVTGPGQDTTHLTFNLTPGATLRGTISSDEGDPVAGARIMLFRRPKHPGQDRMGLGETAITDDTGGYELSGLAPGDYFMAVIADPWYAVHDGAPDKRNPALDVVYPVTYFDSTIDESSATPISLAGGTSEEANISLHAVPALRLNFAVSRKTDGSLAQPSLEQTVFGNVVSSGVGIVALQTNAVEMYGIAPGQYQLTQGDPPRVVGLDLSANQQIDPNAGISANAVSGRLQLLPGRPPPDDAMVSLERIDNSPGQSIYATVARRGQFKFDTVPAGEWAVAVTSGNRPLAVVEISVGASSRAGNIVNLRERSGELVVTLSDSETDVKGFAKKDGKGLAGAMIVLLPRNPAQWRALTRRDQSDSDGSFALHNVVPGDYTVLAIANGWDLDWTSPQAMARYLPGGTTVRVSESSGKLVQLGAPLTIQEP